MITKLKTACIAIFVLCFMLTSAQAQKENFTGKINDQSDAAVPDISVEIKGTSNGTSGNSEGKFSLVKINPSTLIFSDNNN